MSDSQQAPYPVDLQLHSTASDGTDSPTALVQLAARRGVRAMALTDHDSVLGVDEALIAARAEGVWVIPALEFSTRSELQRDYADINILAYGIEPHDPDLDAMLQQVIDSRIEQKIRQIERLQAYGLDVPVTEVLASAQGVPGRIHIARVAMARNPQKFSSIQDVFAQYLGADSPNPTSVTRTFSLTVEDAIALTHAAGGIAVLAHPGIYTRVRDVDGAVRRMQQAGLDGIEVSYTYAQNRGHFGASASAVTAIIEHFGALADTLGLLQTGGSDYHGTSKPGILPGQAGLTWEAWEALANRLGWEQPAWLR
ncbi:MAG: PHP domain-containing protein [Caldilineaceae bacterium]|nr:PHP domain-containing protein [Caldilineaceae bacterium]